MTYLHSKKVIHRAIHPSNILFASSEKDDFIIKVSGYESASSFTSKSKSKVENDEEYTPPEILDKNPGDLKVDIWALGILTYYLVENSTPFFFGETDELADNIKSLDVTFNNEKLTEECKDFIRKCLAKDPAERPTAKALNRHDWMKMNSSKGAIIIDESDAK